MLENVSCVVVNGKGRLKIVCTFQQCKVCVHVECSLPNR